ncbi:hypothetical protein D915_000385 [Fasciola hepatica]|uniref:Uncharacterized protein n=1 Tax=Fasciola hepatica TaxID=6192 RepID=A0A4E0S461_FASHE|nr:hypothetical protein D915_000385 [Fasciola hepatica]
MHVTGDLIDWTDPKSLGYHSSIKPPVHLPTMARRSGTETESYAAYLSRGEVDDLYSKLRDRATNHSSLLAPPPQFYTTNSGMKCCRYCCSVCGPKAKVNWCHGAPAQLAAGHEQRNLEWISGTTLPDALSRARTAQMIRDDFLQISK